MKRTLKLKESELKRMISESVRKVLNEQDEKWALINELYYSLGQYTSKIKEIAQDAYKRATDDDEKRIIKSVWDNANNIEYILSDPDNCISSNTVLDTDDNTIEYASNDFIK